jgi:protein subunit release factor A
MIGKNMGEHIKNILAGTNHPHYVKLLKNAGINKKWRSMKSIMIELKNRCEENYKELQDEKQELIKALENMLVFAEKIDTEKALLEMLFCAINKEEDMLYLLKENPNQQYLKICKKWYGAIA